MKSVLSLALLLGAAPLFGATDGPRVRQSFDFDWRFHLGDVPGASAPVVQDASWRRIDLPHDFSAEGEFSRTNASGTGFLPGGIGWYRKSFVVPDLWKGKVVGIEFDGVSMNSEVWVNGHFLGKRPNPYSTFHYELTPHLRFGTTNSISVRADHSEIADSRWYVGSGIYRHVWLIATEPVRVARHGVHVTSPTVEAGRAQVKVQTRVQNGRNAAAETELLTELIGPDGRVARSATHRSRILAEGDTVFEQMLEVPAPQLWSPETPALYQAVSTVRVAGETVDRLATTFGIRSIRFDAQQGFFLNGKPTKFKGLCMHHDAGVVGAAVPDQVLERRLRIATEIGCNAIRTSHNPMAPEFYDLCDRLGLLVMDEAFDEWTAAKRKWVEGWNAGTPSLRGAAEYFEEWAEADLREMVLRDRNHPSIVLWSIGNEIDYPNDPFNHPADGAQYNSNRPPAEILARTAPRLIEVVRECDDSRPITAALANVPASNATGLADLLDVAGYNYQVPQYERDFARYPDRKFVGSETSHALDAYAIAQHPRVSGQFLWVGFDFLGEAGGWPSRGSGSGLFDTCAFLKPRGFLREALWSEKPVVRIAVAPPGGRRGNRGPAVENHWNWQEDSRAALPVEVYSNCDTVELFLNGSSLGRKSASEGTNSVFRWNVPFRTGELKAAGSRAGVNVESSLRTAGRPARIELLADRTELAADGRAVAHVELRLVDERGTLVPNADVVCSVEVAGAGRLLGLDNGNQRDISALTDASRRLNRGRALAIVQSARQSGTISFTASSPDLPAARIDLKVTD